MATANSRRNKDALGSDLYTTPSWAVEALLKREGFSGDILDAGCGKGAISDVLLAGGYKDVVGIDLHDWGYGQPGIDFLQYQESHDNVVSNPPFSILNEFILQALKLAKNKVAIFARINALESQNRFRDIYKVHQPARVYSFVNRVKCMKGGHDDGTSSAVFYCWTVWDLKKKSNVTELHWIDDKPPRKPTTTKNGG